MSRQSVEDFAQRKYSVIVGTYGQTHRMHSTESEPWVLRGVRGSLTVTNVLGMCH